MSRAKQSHAKMILPLAWICGILILAALAPAKSIFDFDDKALEPPAHPETDPLPAPSKPASIPTPNPAPTDQPSKSPKPEVTNPAPAPAPVTAPKTSHGSQTIPPLASREKSMAYLKEAYVKELADRNPASRRDLSRRLLVEAEKAKSNPTDEFVLLVGSYQSAMEAGDWSLCTRAVDAVSDDFTVDPLALKTQCLIKTSVKSDTPAHTMENCQAGLDLVRELMRVGDVTAAARIVTMLKEPSAVDPAISQTVKSEAKRVEAAVAERTRVAGEMTRLRTTPDDPNANFAAGKFLCFYCRAWERGLGYLSKGPAAKTKDAAVAELALTDGSPAMLDVGDLWWTLAASEPEPARAAIRAHAAELYSRGIDQASPLRQQALGKRITEASDATGVRVINLLPMIDLARDRLVGHWTAASNGLAVTSSENFPRVQIRYQPPLEYDFRMDFTYEKGGGPFVLICPTSDGPIEFNAEFNKNIFLGRDGPLAHGTGPFIIMNKPNSAIVKVRVAGVQGFLNGKLVCELKRDGKSLDMKGAWKVRDANCLGAGVWNSTGTLTRIEITQISGSGKRLPD